MPITQKEMGVTNVYDPRENIAAGTAYFIKQFERFDGDLDKALWAYNAGATRVEAKLMPHETEKYLQRMYLYFYAMDDVE